MNIPSTTNKTFRQAETVLNKALTERRMTDIMHSPKMPKDRKAIIAQNAAVVGFFTENPVGKVIARMFGMTIKK